MSEHFFDHRVANEKVFQPLYPDVNCVIAFFSLFVWARRERVRRISNTSPLAPRSLFARALTVLLYSFVSKKKEVHDLLPDAWSDQRD